MIDSPKTRLNQGLLPLVGFALLTAALDVFAGNQLQAHSPATVAAISFTLATVFFLSGAIIRQGVAATLRPLRTCRYDVVMINVTTAVTWLSMLYALKYLEPAVVNVVGLALGPLLTVLVSPLLRPGTSVLRTEFVVSLGIVGLIGLLAWGSFNGHSAVGELSAVETIVGVGLTLLTGLGSVTNVIYSKRLSDAKLTPQSILAVRFFLMLAVTWTIVATSAKPGLGTAFLPSLLIAVLGVALPLYLLQVGIKHTEPITASILLTLSPLFAVALQLLDRRLTLSALTLTGVVGIVVLVAVGMVARTRYESRTATDSARHPAVRSADNNPPG
ncbi:MAG TPA: DMT family transporter [Pseudonocardiaceae bacterium]|nr:DMT family transporter [Pseudonocardiaceae bacterium]